jgi:hypothetical protein
MPRSLQELWAHEDADQVDLRQAQHRPARRRARHGRRPRQRLVVRGKDRAR